MARVGRGLARLCLALALPGSLACSGPTRAPPPSAAPLVVASDLDNMPFAGVDENGRPIGRDVEMMAALAARLGRPIEWRQIPFETLLPSVQAGLVDVVCATVGITAERATKVAFSEPYFETVIDVVVRAGDDSPRRWADLDGRKVAAGRGTTSERAVRRVLPRSTGVFENKAGLSAAERLAVGDVDGVAMDGPNAQALVAASNGTLSLLETPLAAERYALALPPDRPELTRALDRALASMRRGGELAALDAAWKLSSSGF